MSWADWRLRLRALLRHRGAESELREEVAFHQAMAARAGRPASAFGAEDRILEECRDARGLRPLEDLGRDLRFALRRLRHAPGFAAVAIASLALGIGANTALFTLVDAALLRRLPVPHAEQLALLGEAGFHGLASGIADHDVPALTFQQYLELRDQNHSFTGVAAVSAAQFTMAVDWGASTDAEVPLKLVSANYFDVLELQPARGRFFDAAEATANAAPEAVLSYGYWQSHLGGADDAVGRTLRLRGRPYTVIGVAPRGFEGTTVGQAPALYFPLELQGRVLPGRDLLHDPPGITRQFWLLGFGRLRPGVSLAQARSDAAVIFASSIRRQAALAPDAATRADLLTQYLPVSPAATGASSVRESFGQPLWILMGLVGLVLLAVVVNLGGMLLAQAAARQREFALRTALGAGRGRLIRQMLSESLLLAALGGGLGWLLAQWGERALVSMVAGGDAGFGLPLSADPRVLGFTLGICVLAGVGFGLAPALRLTRRDLARQAARARRLSTGGAMVVAQAGLAIVLATGAALFARSLRQLRTEPLGFQPAHLILFSLNAPAAGATGARALEVYQPVAEALRQLPGVTAATYSENGLFTGQDSGDEVTLEGYSGGNANAHLDSVAPGYFSTIGAPILRGREFTAADRSRTPAPVVIDESLARRYFAGRDPLGQMATVHFTFGDATYQIVGVSGHVQEQDLRERTSIPRLYFDLENRGALYPVSSVNFEVRTAPGAKLDRSRVDRAVARASGLPLRAGNYDTVQGYLDASLAPDKLLALLAGFFGVLALGLAAMGLYAMLSYALARRRTEIGVRMALGARASQVTAMVLREAALLLGLGIAAGVAASLALGRGLANLLFQLRPDDPVSLASAAALLLACGLAAALFPALRASRTDPARTLRCE